MKALKLVLAASVIAAGCAVSPPDNTFAFNPGVGTVDSVREARVAVPGGAVPQTALGRMTKPRWIEGYQLSLRMDDGSTQSITQDSGEFRAGDRVQVTPQGRVLKVPANAGAGSTTVQPSR